ncbi:hypothetical protein CRG98_021058 [Punica granatum]|uniref:Uncharacterized protein n=1 Tax=Punica granatum TaxID=22663 RepID=A0A2I0JRN2_PUNGR|nr:hypothetical protein CRG98_021058 [Punica granatum]
MESLGKSLFVLPRRLISGHNGGQAGPVLRSKVRPCQKALVVGGLGYSLSIGVVACDLLWREGVMRARRRMCDGCAEVACTGTMGCARTTRRDALGGAFRRVRDIPRNVLGHIEGAIGHAGISVGQLRHGRKCVTNTREKESLLPIYDPRVEGR